MKTCWITLLTLSLSLNLQAQVLSGDYSWHFSGIDLPVFELEETLFLDEIAGIEQEVHVELLPSGQIVGSYSGSYDDWGISVFIQGTLNGRISSKATQYKVQIAGKGPVSGTVYGDTISGNASFNVNVLADTSTHEAYMMQKVSVCLRGYGCEGDSQVGSFEIENALSGDGDWTLNCNLTNQNSSITGTARAILINGGEADFQVRGKYSASSGMAKLQLRGVGAAKGAKLQVTTDSAAIVRSVRGKVFGQNLNKSF